MGICLKIVPLNLTMVPSFWVSCGVWALSRPRSFPLNGPKFSKRDRPGPFVLEICPTWLWAREMFHLQLRS